MGGFHVPGIDCNLSPPKSMSALLPFVSPAEQAALEQAHLAAVQVTLKELEARVAACRPTVNGEQIHTPGELGVAVFTHHTSRPTAEVAAEPRRPPDPQLRSHAFIFNLAFCQGRYRAVDSRPIYQFATTAEAIYAHAHRAASHPAAGGEHLARCAAVALTAGDPTFAEELAGRAWPGRRRRGVAIRATALLRLGDPAAVRALAGGLERASAAGRLDVALAVGRAMHRGGLPAPALPDVLVRATAAPLFLACLAAATVLAIAAPERLAAVLALGFLALSLGTAIVARRG